MMLKTITSPRSKLIDRPTCLCHSDHGHIQMIALQHRLQRGEDFFIRQIARGSVKNKGIG
jgi:hypothetical protein